MSRDILTELHMLEQSDLAAEQVGDIEEVIRAIDSLAGLDELNGFKTAYSDDNYSLIELRAPANPDAPEKIQVAALGTQGVTWATRRLGVELEKGEGWRSMSIFTEDEHDLRLVFQDVEEPKGVQAISFYFDDAGSMRATAIDSDGETLAWEPTALDASRWIRHINKGLGRKFADDRAENKAIKAMGLTALKPPLLEAA